MTFNPYLVMSNSKDTKWMLFSGKNGKNLEPIANHHNIRSPTSNLLYMYVKSSGDWSG